MSKNVRENIELKRKQESRDIVKEIMNFGIAQSQIYDIMFNLSLNIENNKDMKEVSNFLKKYLETFNKEEQTENNSKVDKILLS